MKTPSGKFVLRIPSELHIAAKNEAAKEQISLNEICVRALKNYLHTPLEYPRGQKETAWISAIKDIAGDKLLGVVLFGSTARGERGKNSQWEEHSFNTYVTVKTLSDTISLMDSKIWPTFAYCLYNLSGNIGLHLLISCFYRFQLLL